jgi:hypothetical protein
MFGCWRKNSNQNKLNREFERAIKEIQNDPLMGLNVDSIKAKYGNNFYELREIINKNDPIGLISMGAPEDEYEAEVKTIIVQLDRIKNKEETLDLIYSEFEKWFGNAGKKENFRKMASEINMWLEKNKK